MSLILWIITTRKGKKRMKREVMLDIHPEIESRERTKEGKFMERVTTASTSSSLAVGGHFYPSVAVFTDVVHHQKYRICNGG